MFQMCANRLPRRLVSLLRLLLTLLASTAGAHSNVLAAHKVMPPEDGYLVRQIRVYRRTTWQWQRVMGERPSPSSAAERDPSHAYRRWVRDLWRQRAISARRRAKNPPRKQEWLCIHSHEGAWNDPNPTYYGGLQMDIDFQREWAPGLLARKGTADHWTPLEQIWVAERAYRSGLGFTPWPNTARMCGLL
jgi:hypothetical protein